jgi:putative ABC transport system permease protein
MEMIYAAMTAQVKDVYAENPPVTSVESFMGFVSFMSDSELSMLLDNMFGMIDPAMTPMVFGALKSTLPADSPFVIDSKEDLLHVLPILTLEQRMTVVGTLVRLCSEEALQGLFAAMNEIIMEMKVDENTFLILLQMMDDAQFAQTQDTLYNMAPKTDATLKSTLKLLGDAESADPASINFYAKDFASKDSIEAIIKEYNDSRENEKDKLQYTDVIGIMMSSISVIIDVISYVLVAFVSISLVVSSIMIGIITYISVLERTKEIGILRAIGASKRDISRVFNAETMIVGFTAGLIGILGTLLLTIPINAIIYALSGIAGVKATLPLVAAIVLVVISITLTFISGLIPSRVASKKDPVEALRSE